MTHSFPTRRSSGLEQRLPGVSKWAFSFGAEANAESSLFGQDGQVYLGYDGSYRSDWSSNPSPSAYTWIEGYSLSNFRAGFRSEEHTSELQSLMRISYAVFCLKKKTQLTHHKQRSSNTHHTQTPKLTNKHTKT